jgi:hypothetical protein
MKIANEYEEYFELEDVKVAEEDWNYYPK